MHNLDASNGYTGRHAGLNSANTGNNIFKMPGKLFFRVFIHVSIHCIVLQSQTTVNRQVCKIPIEVMLSSDLMSYV